MRDIQRCEECNKLLGIILEDGSMLIGDNRVIDIAMYCSDCGHYYEWKKCNVSRFTELLKK